MYGAGIDAEDEYRLGAPVFLGQRQHRLPEWERPYSVHEFCLLVSVVLIPWLSIPSVAREKGADKSRGPGLAGVEATGTDAW